MKQQNKLHENMYAGKSEINDSMSSMCLDRAVKKLSSAPFHGTVI